jgi:hypothetical protein
MTLANPLRKVASKLMARFGGVVTYRRVVNGIYNASTGTVSENTVDSTIRGIVENVTSREVGGLVKAGDKKLTVAANDFAASPALSDLVIISGQTSQIVQISTIEQDNTPITYELILRN